MVIYQFDSEALYPAPAIQSFVPIDMPWTQKHNNVPLPEIAMKRASRLRRTPCHLPSKIHKNLNAYALSATAAGVAVLAMVPTAAGEVVYTPAHQVIPQNRGGVGFLLDLNHDGINDFTIVNFYSTTSALLNVWISPVHGYDEIFSSVPGYAAALPAGVTVGSNGRFHPAQSQDMANDDFPVGNCQGPWKEAHNKYLGLKFAINLEVHFGWARLSVTCFTPRAAAVLLTGYAYETVAGQCIITGDIGGAEEHSASALRPDSPSAAHLGLLALGSCGLAAWRREEAE